MGWVQLYYHDHHHICTGSSGTQPSWQRYVCSPRCPRSPLSSQQGALYGKESFFSPFLHSTPCSQCPAVSGVECSCRGSLERCWSVIEYLSCKLVVTRSSSSCSAMRSC